MSKIFPKSPYIKIRGIVHLARMLDKIRLNESGKLSPEYQEKLGMTKGFDGRCCTFLRVNFATLVEQVKKGGTDEEILDWCFSQGFKPTEDEIQIWSAFMMKRGWLDDGSERLQSFIKEAGLEKHEPRIETFFDFIEVDEDRTPRCTTI